MFELIRSQLTLMAASGTSVFFRFTTAEGKSGKTDIMTPESAAVFLDVSDALGIEFAHISMDREERY